MFFPTINYEIIPFKVNCLFLKAYSYLIINRTKN